MITTTSAAPQAQPQDVVSRCMFDLGVAFTNYKHAPTRDNANAFQTLLTETMGAMRRALMSSRMTGVEVTDKNGRKEIKLIPLSSWRDMASAPAGEAAVSIDIWCSDSECRRTDCFWHEGRWCYEVFEDKYRVVPVRSPAAWMPAPTKPEFPAV